MINKQWKHNYTGHVRWHCKTSSVKIINQSSYANCYKWNRIFAVEPALDWLSACDWNMKTQIHQYDNIILLHTFTGEMAMILCSWLHHFRYLNHFTVTEKWRNLWCYSKPSSLPLKIEYTILLHDQRKHCCERPSPSHLTLGWSHWHCSYSPV